LALYAMGMAALAGWGADALWRHRGRVARRTILIFVVVLVVLMGWAAIGVRIGGGQGVGWPTVAGWIVGIGLALGLLLMTSRAPRLATMSLLTLLIVELFAASATLPHTHATAPQAFTSLRPSIAHLLATPLPLGGGGGGGESRFLSMSNITFDPGDMIEIEIIYGPQLGARALYDYMVAAKQKEVLSPNLPLAFGVTTVDGYDGGVLPLTQYVTLQRLFLSKDEVSIDGRLRENLTAIPDGRWLNLFNVQHVITDKLYDAWLDDVFYDLQFGARLLRGETAAVARTPRFEATALGFVSYLRGGTALPDGTPVGVVEIGFGDGITRTFTLRAGEHTAEGLYGPGVTHAQAMVGGHFWPGQPEGNDYVTRLRWREPAVPTAVTVRATLSEGELVVRGVSLIDERTGGFQALVLSDRGRSQLVHSGDVKIYENLDALPRAFIVHEAGTAPDDEAALLLMQDPTFDPATELVLSGDEGAALTGKDAELLPDNESVRVTHYAPERVEIEMVADAPGYLVLADAWYPGWEATVDGEPTPILRADLLFRAVAVDGGEHRVVFTFRPVSLRVGAVVSLATFIVLIVVAALSKFGRNAIIGSRG
jgi:hypothetical protein